MPAGFSINDLFRGVGQFLQNQDMTIAVVTELFRNAEVQDPFLADLREWGVHLLERSGRWRAVLQSGIRCDVPVRGSTCGRGAVGACVVCRKPACLAHSLISAGADVVCFACVQQAAHAAGNGTADARGPNVGPAGARQTKEQMEDQLRRKHLKTLGLGPRASLEDVKTSFKKIAAKNHPDRLGRATDAKRAESIARFKAASEAHHWLLEHMTKAAA